MTDDVKALLLLASDEVAHDAGEWAAAAWGQARQERRRRLRATAALTGAVALLAVLLAWQLWATRTGRPEPAAPRPTSTQGLALDSVMVDGARVMLGPTPQGERQLARWPLASATGLPDTVDLSPASPATPLGAGASGRVRMVLLRAAGGGRLQPVAYIPGRESPYAALDLTLARVTDASGNPAPMLGPRTISDDGHRLLFPQRGEVVVVDVRTAAVTHIAVPGRQVMTPGWAKDGRTVVVEGDGDFGPGAPALVDTDTRRVSPVAGRVCADWSALVGQGGADPLLVSGSARGVVSDERRVPLPGLDPWRGSVANLEGWTASAAFLGVDLQNRVGAAQGMVAVQTDTVLRPLLLLATDAPGVMKGAYVALGWSRADTVLFASRTNPRPDGYSDVRVLAWDVINARLWQVLTLGSTGAAPGQLNGEVALAP